MSGAWRLSWTVLACAVVAGIGVVDYLTGVDVGFSLFYLMPVVAAGYRLGTTSALLVGVLASLTWFVADMGLRPDEYLGYALWNGATRLGMYGGIAVLLGTLQRERAHLAVTNDKLRAVLLETEHLARTDALTGLANARAFREQLEVDTSRAARGSPLCLAYVDLDNFKQVNDRFGHAGGDEVLRKVGDILRGSLRKGDIPARLGGDEFAIVLWDAGPIEAAAIARRVIEQITRLGENYAGTNLGASVGIASLKEAPETVAGLLTTADNLMYEVKRAGKGHVKVLEVPFDRATRSDQTDLDH